MSVNNLRRITRLSTVAFMGFILSVGCGGSSGSTDVTTDPPSTLTLTKLSVTTGSDAVARDFYIYKPSNYDALFLQDARQIPIVFSFHDNGQTAQENATETRWHELAEQYGFVVVFPEALKDSTGKTVWNETPTATFASDGTTVAATSTDDLLYVKNIWVSYCQNGTTGLNMSSGNPTYITGIGKGGSFAQQFAMIGSHLSTMQVISAVASLKGTAASNIFSLPAYTNSASAGASLPTTSASVWVLYDSATPPATLTQQVDYWKNLNGVAATSTTASDDYFATETFANSTNSLKKVCVSTYRSKLSGKRISDKIWKEMFSKVLRFLDDTRVNGSLHKWETISEMGLKECSKDFGITDSSSVSLGTMRWLEYVPSNYSTLISGGKKLPLVLSLHGRKGSARFQAMMTQWHKVAEKYGFIMVYPHGPGATWSASITTTAGAQNTNVDYILALINEIKTKYAIDEGRIYMNGTSMGALMTNRMAVQYPEKFAGIAPNYSGHLSASTYTNYSTYPDIRTDVPLPVWQGRGGDEPDTAYPGGLAGQEAARNFWRQVVNGGRAWNGTTETSEDSLKTTLATVQNNGSENRRHIYIYNSNNDSGMKCEYRWEVTDYVPHFWHMDDMSELLWTDFFAKYRRNTTTNAIEVIP